MIPPKTQRKAVAFIDGQNLFHNARRVFGYQLINYDVVKLANAVCNRLGSHLVQTRFYTGIPRLNVDPDTHHFWESKTASMKQNGVIVYTRPLPRMRFPKEKGIDVRISLDAFTSAIERVCDDIVIFSNDQDFTELKPHVERVAHQQDRQIRLVSAYPFADGNQIRGITGFEEHKIPQNLYDQCIDPRDYRPRRKRN